MIKRIFAVLLALVIAVLGVRALFRALQSDETKIRWTLEGMVEAYNEGDVGDVIYPIAADWKHDGVPVTREDVRARLTAEYFQGRDPRTKKLNRRVAIDFETIEITVDGDDATAEFDATFEKLDRGGTWEFANSAHIVTEHRRGEAGWFIHRSRHEDLRNTMLSR